MRKNHVWLLSLLILFLFSACSTPRINVDEQLLSDSDLYEVQGRQGWLANQTLSFGEFQSGKVDRSWTKGYDYPFIVRFTGAKEKLSYTLKGGKDLEADVFCIGKLREQDLRLFHRYFDINLNAKDIFSGTVVLGEEIAYDFYVMNLNQNNVSRAVEGRIIGEDSFISIEPIKKLEGNKAYLSAQAPGFEFKLNGQVIGAVEVLNKGRIWIKKDLSEENRLLVASVASALLLRSDLEGHNDNV